MRCEVVDGARSPASLASIKAPRYRTRHRSFRNWGKSHHPTPLLSNHIAYPSRAVALEATVLESTCLNRDRSKSQRLASRHGDPSVQKICGIPSIARTALTANHATFPSATLQRLGLKLTTSRFAIDEKSILASHECPY